MPSSFRIARWARRGVLGRPRLKGRLGRVAARFFLYPNDWSSTGQEPKSVREEKEEWDRKHPEENE